MTTLFNYPKSKNGQPLKKGVVISSKDFNEFNQRLNERKGWKCE